MKRFGVRVCIYAIPLGLLWLAAPVHGQAGFDFEAFGQLMEEGQVLYDAAQVLDEEDHEQRRSLLIESSEAQIQAIDMLHQALVAGAFSGVDRDEAAVRLLELNISVVVLLVETGSCDAAESRWEGALADPDLLPQQGAQDLIALRPSIRDCEEHVVAVEEPIVEPAESTSEPEPEEIETTELPIEDGSDSSRPLRTATWVTGSVSVACFITSVAFYLRGNSLQSDLDDELSKPRFDPDRAQSLWSDIEQSETLMNAFLWSGVALATTAAILAIVDLSMGDDEVIIAPAAAPGGAYVGINWRF